MSRGRTHLYRHFDADDNLLYIGISLNALKRLGQHAKHSSWFESIAKVTLQAFDSREEALTAEKEAILAERPAFNQHHNKPRSRRSEDVQDRSNEGVYGGRPATEVSREALIARVAAYKPFYTLEEAARLLRCAEAALVSEFRKHRLSYVKLANGRRGVTGWQVIDYLEMLEAEAMREGGWNSMASAPIDGTVVFALCSNRSVCEAEFQAYDDMEDWEDGWWTLLPDGQEVEVHPIAWRPCEAPSEAWERR